MITTSVEAIQEELHQLEAYVSTSRALASKQDIRFALGSIQVIRQALHSIEVAALSYAEERGEVAS